MDRTSASRPPPPRHLALIAGLAVLLAALAVPALAAPSPRADGAPAAPAAEASADPSPKTPRGPKPKGPKAKVEQAPITLRGTVRAARDADGRREYRLTSDGTTYVLDGGPAWWYGEDHPLEPFVGRTVTITGGVAEGSTEVDVATVDGEAIRAAGRPPWAGGWKVVGERHPGWSQEKADRWEQHLERKRERFGGCFPPGHCREDGAADLSGS